MPEWMIWTIVAGIGLVVAILTHAFSRQSQGAALVWMPLLGIAGALLAAWIVPRFVDMAGMALTEERYIWAAVGGLALSLISEFGSVGSHRSRIVIPAPGR